MIRRCSLLVVETACSSPVPDKEKITGLQRKGFSVYFIDNAVILCKHNFNIVMPVQTEIGGDMRNGDIVNIAVGKMIVFEKRSRIVFHGKKKPPYLINGIIQQNKEKI